MCVPSCKDLTPASYIYENTSLPSGAINKNKCVRNCSLTDKMYVD